MEFQAALNWRDVRRFKDKHHIPLILKGIATAEDADRIAREVGGPWMREHIRPLLAGDTERNVGEVIASAP